MTGKSLGGKVLWHSLNCWMALLAWSVSKPLLVVAQTWLEPDAWGRIAFIPLLLGKLGTLWFFQVPSGCFQVSGDLVSSWPVGDFSGEIVVFLQAGVCVALCQSLLFYREAVASGGLFISGYLSCCWWKSLGDLIFPFLSFSTTRYQVLEWLNYNIRQTCLYTVYWIQIMVVAWWSWNEVLSMWCECSEVSCMNEMVNGEVRCLYTCGVTWDFLLRFSLMPIVSCTGYAGVHA